MAADHVIPELDTKGLRKFAFTTGGVFVALFGLFFPWLLERAWPLWPWLILAALGALALLAPAALRPIHIGWMKFALLLSRVTTPVILGSVFFILFAPVGLIKRMRGSDGMRRSFDKAAATYRVPSTRHPPEKLEKPF